VPERYAVLPQTWYSRMVRGALLSAYVLFALSGLAAALWPVRAVEQQVQTWQETAWTVLFVLGSLCCAFGTLLDVWIGELVGLPQLITVFLVFGVASFLASKPTAVTVAGGLFLLAIAAYFAARWAQVWHIKNLSLGGRR